MSALPLKADMFSFEWDVGFVPQAELGRHHRVSSPCRLSLMTTKFLPGSSNSLVLAVGSPVNQQVIASGLVANLPLA